MKKEAAWIMLALASALPAQNAFAWGKFDGGHHPAYGGKWVRPAPVVVHKTYVEHGHGGGCVGCGVGIAAVAGLIGGAIIGSAIAGSSSAPSYEPPPAPPPEVIVYAPPVGSEVPALPPGCQSMNVNGVNYYRCGGIWYQPFFGGNGVYYTVVPAP